MTVTDNHAGRASASELRALLDSGHQLTYTPEATGGFFAIVRDTSGRLIECGLGRTQAEALAHLSERLERNAPAMMATEGVPGLLAELDRADRIDMVSVMTADEQAGLLVFIAGYAPEVFGTAVMSRSDTFADELLERIDVRDAEQEANDPDGYCTTYDEMLTYAKAHGLDIMSRPEFGDGWYAQGATPVRMTVPENWPLWPIEAKASILLDAHSITWPNDDA